jgi:hypothetical protein
MLPVLYLDLIWLHRPYRVCSASWHIESLIHLTSVCSYIIVPRRAEAVFSEQSGTDQPSIPVARTVDRRDLYAPILHLALDILLKHAGGVSTGIASALLDHGVIMLARERPSANCLMNIEG